MRLSHGFVRSGSALVLACFVASSCTPAVDPEESEERPPTGASSRVFGAPPPAPLPELRFERGAPSVSFFALGDTGWGGETLRANAAGMELSAEARPVDFVLLVGDNFYRNGAESIDDPRWQSMFEEVFSGPRLQVPFYATLGNHDHRGHSDVEIEYSQHSSRWRMPKNSYIFRRALVEGGEVEFFALDTQAVHAGETIDGFLLQRWLEDELQKSNARWKIAFGHHPALSHGQHGGTAEFVEDIVPLFERYGIDLYISGHDHDLQLLRSKAGWLQLVSGAGSSTRDTSYGADTLFASASPGFVWVGVSAHEMWIEIATAAGGPQFRWKVEKP